MFSYGRRHISRVVILVLGILPRMAILVLGALILGYF